MTDWLSQLWDTLTSVSVPLLVLGLAFQTAQTAFVALAWRNILRASYPEGGVRYRTILGYYAGGNGLNAILPASAGTVAMLGLFRSSIPGSTVATRTPVPRRSSLSPSFSARTAYFEAQYTFPPG